jgi:hypothetical protein
MILNFFCNSCNFEMKGVFEFLKLSIEVILNIELMNEITKFQTLMSAKNL